MSDISRSVMFELQAEEADEQLISAIVKHAISATTGSKGTITEAVLDNGVELALTKGHHGYHLYLKDEKLYKENESSETTLSYERMLLRLTELANEEVDIRHRGERITKYS
jgi:hypothetical protein